MENNRGATSPFGTEPEAVQYGVVLLYKAPMSGKVGSAVPIKIKLTNAAGQNVSSSSLQVQALCVVVQGAQDCSGTPPISYGSGSPFTYSTNLAPGGGYQFTVKSTGLSTGKTYQMLFRVQGEPNSVYHVGPPAATFTLTK